MDENLDRMTLSELIELGQQQLIEMQEEEKQTRFLEEKSEKEKQRNFLAAAGECLPAALRNYLEFRCWHRPSYELGEGWTAEAYLRVPCCNLIRLLYRQGDGDSYHLYIRNVVRPVLVIEHSIGSDGELGYGLNENIHSRYDDVLLALAVAAQLGDDLPELQNKIIELNADIESQQQVQEENILPEKPLLPEKTELELTIDAAVRMCDNGRLNEASVLSTIAIARALKSGIEMWNNQPSSELSDSVRIWGDGK